MPVGHRAQGLLQSQRSEGPARDPSLPFSSGHVLISCLTTAIRQCLWTGFRHAVFGPETRRKEAHCPLYFSVRTVSYFRPCGRHHFGRIGGFHVGAPASSPTSSPRSEVEHMTEFSRSSSCSTNSDRGGAPSSHGGLSANPWYGCCAGDVFLMTARFHTYASK
jgi:hypothetical protein